MNMYKLHHYIIKSVVNWSYRQFSTQFKYWIATFFEQWILQLHCGHVWHICFPARQSWAYVARLPFPSSSNDWYSHYLSSFSCGPWFAYPLSFLPSPPDVITFALMSLYSLTCSARLPLSVTSFKWDFLQLGTEPGEPHWFWVFLVFMGRARGLWSMWTNQGEDFVLSHQLQATGLDA